MNKLTLDNWKQIGLQVLGGALLGASVTIAATENWTVAGWIAIGCGAIKGAAQIIVSLFEPKTTAAKKQMKSHWTSHLKLL